MQIILGLQSNALKFTSSGYVKITVKIKEVTDEFTETEENFIEISVEDTGLGISE